MAFASRLEAQARTLLHHHLDTATSEYALSTLMAALPLELAGPPAPGYHQHHQQQQQGMLPPGGRRGHAAAAAAAGSDEPENVPPQEADEEGTQVRQGWPAAQVGLA
jgi:hypothetical protein